MKCVVITVTYMVELQDRVLAPWGPSSISAVAELVLFILSNSNRIAFCLNQTSSATAEIDDGPHGASTLS